LDYSKGIRERMEAYERFLVSNPDERGHVTYLQIAPARPIRSCGRSSSASIKSLRAGCLSKSPALKKWSCSVSWAKSARGQKAGQKREAKMIRISLGARLG
jgi:hypothetical protein